MRVGAAGEQERGHVCVQGFACPGVAVGFRVDRPAEEGPPVAVVVLDVVSGVDQVAQAVEVVIRDRLVGWGQQLPPRFRAAPADVFADHLVGDSVRPVPGGELAVDVRDGLALWRPGVQLSPEHVVKDRGEWVEPRSAGLLRSARRWLG
jgi:hypothetical protein